jgi:predicted RNA methylase
MMSKLTKQEIKTHDQAVELLNRGNLTPAEIRYVFDYFREDANHVNSKAGAFFTPYGLARDLAVHIPYEHGKIMRVIDLCAGIGALSWSALSYDSGWSGFPTELTCVEINPDYVEIGRKLVPNATWICGDALDPTLLRSLGHFDFAISNPPFGAVQTSHKKHYNNGQFEYMVIEAAAQIADGGAFIIPQMSAPFVYSGKSIPYWHDKSCRATRFEDKTGILLDFNAGFDTSQYHNDWHGTAIACEIVCCDFTERAGQMSMLVTA